MEVDSSLPFQYRVPVISAERGHSLRAGGDRLFNALAAHIRREEIDRSDESVEVRLAGARCAGASGVRDHGPVVSAGKG